MSVAVPPVASPAETRAPRSHLLRNGIALVINSAISSLLGAGYWFVAAHRTDQATVGQATALVASLTALSTISQLSLPGVLASYLPRAGASARWLVIQAYGVAFALSIVLGSWFAFVAPMVDDGFAPLRGIGPLLLFTASVAIWSIFALQDNALTGLRMAVWVPLENIVYSAVKLGALIALGTGVGALALLTTWSCRRPSRYSRSPGSSSCASCPGMPPARRTALRIWAGCAATSPATALDSS